MQPSAQGAARGRRPAGWGGIIVDYDHGPGDEPTARADVELGREHTGIHIKGSAPGGFAGEIHVTATGSGHSSTAKAMTMLILVAAACLVSFTFAVICWLAHAPALVLALTAVAGFAGVFTAGAIIAFRRGWQPPAITGRRPVIVQQRVIQEEDSGSVQARQHKAIQNGNGAPRAQPARRNRRARPSRR